ncbi:MAG: hypothetical protein Q7W45_00180 [Bacteroidota bacterium]|nr:hypothetical protein [Bacteroidota bacterium]MDP3146134.1 hypothetical protein [Bacteroidota bacterium]
MSALIELEDYEVLSTGTIIGVANKLIIFKLKDLTFEFEFKNNPEFTEHRINSFVPKDGKKMKLIFDNFNNSLGIGNLEPLEVGYIGTQKLYLNYRVYSLADNTGKLVHYTWLLSKSKGVRNVK